MTALDILNVYISFFEKKGHKRIENSSLVPKDDPTTLFTSSGMQSIIKYLLGEPHPMGKRLVNVQNCFRAQDLDEVGDNRHTTFFRMLGNWSLGDYFKNEQIPWFWEFLVDELKLDPKRLYVSVFEGYKNIPRDEESAEIWSQLFKSVNIEPKERIFYCGVNDNWWSRSGTPDEMPTGEPGGPDTEVYFDLRQSDGILKGSLDENVKSGRLLEIGNSVFMTYRKSNDGSFEELPQKNVDFGGGIERLLAAVEANEDVFQTSLYSPIIKAIEKATEKSYIDNKKQMRLITDHLIASSFIISQGVLPSNKNQGYVLRRLIRRAFDSWNKLGTLNVESVIHSIVEQYKDTDPVLLEKFAQILSAIEDEIGKYKSSITEAKKFIQKKYKIVGDELMGVVKITAEDAFNLYTSQGLSPSQIKSLGFIFDEQEFVEKMKSHQKLSKENARKKFN